MKRIYRQSLGKSLDNIMNSSFFMYIVPACNDHKNGMETLKNAGKKVTLL